MDQYPEIAPRPQKFLGTKATHASQVTGGVAINNKSENSRFGPAIQHNEVEWEAIRLEVTMLFKDQDLKPLEIEHYFQKKDPPFIANKRQWERRLEKWELRTNIPRKKKAAMNKLRDRRLQSYGKKTEFRYMRRAVPIHKLDRDKGSSLDKTESYLSPTPSAISDVTAFTPRDVDSPRGICSPSLELGNNPSPQGLNIGSPFPSEIGNTSSSFTDSRIGSFIGNGRFQLIDMVWSGGCCVIYRAVDIQTGVPYSVKTLRKYTAEVLQSEAQQIDFQPREMWFHQMASSHPNVLRIHKIFEYPDYILLFSEYCTEGNLSSNLNYYVGNDIEAREVFLQILGAVEHCHSLGIYHRYLQPENILVTAQKQQAKLIDFGLAVTDVRIGDFNCASTFYMSPECQNQAPGQKDYACAPSDVWSLGIVLVNMTCGRNLWTKADKEDSIFHAFLKDSNFLKSIIPVSHELYRVLTRVFEIKPEKRITIQELKHEIFGCRHLTTTSGLLQTLP